MPLAGVVNPAQLAVLTAVLDDYCREAGIGRASRARDDAARLIMARFNNGATVDELRAALHATLQRDEQL